jgi:UDP-N-acetyl-D-mannosaminuronic acid dehydrogenase
MSAFHHDVAIVGGAGHVGLPLALLFAEVGLRTVIYDIDGGKIERLERGEMPFLEAGAPDMLARAQASGRLELASSPERLVACRFLVLVVGTPLDEHLNPSFAAVDRTLAEIRPWLRNGQILVLRSTLYPGTSRRTKATLERWGLTIGVACCPERVAQGRSLEEFRSLPQLVSAFDADTLAAVSELFGRFAPELVVMSPDEAELCKLMTNAWRYLQFATVNQFYTVATGAGLDFERILHGCRHHYPRMAGMPGPGLAAGPCLMKDTMQLVAFAGSGFHLGHSAMLVNEGLPAHLVALARGRLELGSAVAGILGMAFKADSDDPRDSLSYKLKKLLALEARAVLCTDPHVPDPTLVPLERVLAEADVLFVAAPHARYRELPVRSGVVVIDVWNHLHPLESP